MGDEELKKELLTKAVQRLVGDDEWVPTEEELQDAIVAFPEDGSFVRCPFCTGWVAANDEESSISHTEPFCPVLLSIMQEPN